MIPVFAEGAGPQRYSSFVKRISRATRYEIRTTSYEVRFTGLNAMRAVGTIPAALYLKSKGVYASVPPP